MNVPFHITARREDRALRRLCNLGGGECVKRANSRQAIAEKAERAAQAADRLAYLQRRITFLLKHGDATAAEICAFTATHHDAIKRALAPMEESGKIQRRRTATDTYWHLTTRKPAEAISAPAGEAHGAKEAAS